jgi:hypothetical protein
LDRRLHRRRDWITPEELAQSLADLPDVSDKIDRSEGEQDEAEGSTSES